MAHHTERHIMEVHKRLDAFELQVLAQPSPIVDLTTLQAAVESPRAYLDTILEAQVLGSEAPSTDPDEDTVLAALFFTTAVPPPPP